MHASGIRILLIAFIAYAVWRLAVAVNGYYKLYRAYCFAGWHGVLPQPWQHLQEERCLQIADAQTSKLWYERIYRMTRNDASNRMYLVDSTPHEDGCFAFHIVGQQHGAKSSVYTVTIAERIACTCADFIGSRHVAWDGSAYVAEGGTHHCKHLFWVKQQVLRIPPFHPLLYRVAYRPWELAYLRRVAHIGVQRPPSTIMELLGYVKPAADASEEVTCCIDIEPLNDGRPIVECWVSCRRWLHEECLQQWKAAKLSDPLCHHVPCPNCKVDWAGNEQPKPMVQRVEQQVVLHNVRPATPKRRRSKTPSRR